MGAESLFSYATLFGFLFALARISGVFAFLPLAVFRAAPETARIVLAHRVHAHLGRSGKRPSGAKLRSAGSWPVSRRSGAGSRDRPLAGDRARSFQDGGAGGQSAGRSRLRLHHRSHQRRGFHGPADHGASSPRAYCSSSPARTGCWSGRWRRACGCAARILHAEQSLGARRSSSLRRHDLQRRAASGGPVIALLLLADVSLAVLGRVCRRSFIWSA